MMSVQATAEIVTSLVKNTRRMDEDMEDMVRVASVALTSILRGLDTWTPVARGETRSGNTYHTLVLYTQRARARPGHVNVGRMGSG